MNTIEEARIHCRFVGEGIERDVAEGKDLGERFEGTQLLRFKVERGGGGKKMVGGEVGGDDSGIIVSGMEGGGEPPEASVKTCKYPVPIRSKLQALS